MSDTDDKPHLDDTTLVLLDMFGPRTGYSPKRLRTVELPVAILEEPHAKISYNRWGFTVEFSTFHWLKHSLDYDSGLDRSIRAIERWARMRGFDESPPLDEMARFYATYTCWTDQDAPCQTCDSEGTVLTELGPVLIEEDGTTVEFEDPDREEDCPTCRGSGKHRPGVRLGFDERQGRPMSLDGGLPDKYEVTGLHGDGDPMLISTEHQDSLLEGCIEFAYFEPGWSKYEELIILRMGSQFRGFSTSSEASIFDYARGSIVCTAEGPYVDEARRQAGHEGHHRWQTDDASNWTRDEDYHPYDAPRLNRYTLRDLTEDGELGEWAPGSIYFTSEPTIIKGVEYPTDTGFCPVCGGILEAWFF